MCLFGKSYYFHLTESLECPKGDNYICKNSHRCISKDYLCDGMNDCWNTFSGADEYFCCKYNCKNSHICISKITSLMAWMIVGTHFLVLMNISAVSRIVRIAIFKDHLYNGMNDCPNTFSGADEYFCCEYNCKDRQRCFSKVYLCEGMNDCWIPFLMPMNISAVSIIVRITIFKDYLNNSMNYNLEYLFWCRWIILL